MPEFMCVVCDTSFSLPEAVLDRYPGWTPKYCRAHSPSKKAKAGSQPPRSAGSKSAWKSSGGAKREENLTLEQVLDKYSDGPQTGVFTDGSCSPNPGPGGWGVAWLQDGALVQQARGAAADTTNNRMELIALIEAMKMIGPDQAVVVFTDSQLCANTINQWAAGWAARGWKRKAGPIKNLELVQELYTLKLQRPLVKIEWIAAHSGFLGNELADSLATAWMRDTV